MGIYEDLKAAIADVITTNGKNEITGAILNDVLQNIVSSIGEHATFAGIATPDVQPGTVDQNVFYLATIAGTYIYFDKIVVNSGEVAILTNKTGSWKKKFSGLATQEKLTELEKKVSNIIIDSEMSDTSENAVSNKVIKAYVDRVKGYIDDILGKNVTDAIDNINEILAFLSTISDKDTLAGIFEELKQYIDNADNLVKQHIDNVVRTLAAVAKSGSYNDLIDKPIIPAAVTESTISEWGFTKNTGTIKGIIMNGVLQKESDGNVNLGTVITDISGKQEKLISGTNIKTLNGISLLGSGNIQIGGSIPCVEMTSEIASIKANEFYVWQMVNSLNITLISGSEKVMNRYIFQFRNPKETTTLLTLPDDITWSEDTELDDNGLPIMEASAFYRIEIIEGLANLKKWKLAYIQFADKGVESVLMDNGIGDGIGITKQDAKAVTSISNWFKNNTTITSFDELRYFTGITNLVGYLNDGAFQGCTNLRGIVLPPNLTIVGQSSFQGCTALEYLNIPQGVHDIPQTFCKGCSALSVLSVNWELILTIGTETFSGCAALVAEIISNSIRSIADWAFYNTGVKGTLHLPALEDIGNRSFKNTGIEQVTSLGKITELGKYSTWNGAGYGTFAGCTALWHVVLHEGIALIGQSAFHGCTALTDLNWVDSIETIEQEAFRDTPQMAIEISPSNNLKKIADWAFYNSGVSGDLYLPNLEEIKNRSFKNCKNLQSVSSLGKITELGKYESWNGNGYGVFAGCTSLMSVRGVSNVTLIGQSAFQGCTALKEDAFDWNKVTIVEQDAFADCTSWELEVVMTSLVTVGSGAFRMTPKTSIIIDCPNLTGTIGSRAFTGSGVTEVRNLGSITSIANYNNNAQYNGWAKSNKLKFFRLPATCVEIPSMAFRDCPLLETFISESEVPPTAGARLFDNTPCVIYVPDASVEAYKAAVNWNAYADRIKGISEYTG